jgi:hypothetical protein
MMTKKNGKWVITVSQEATYEFDMNKYTEEEACDQAWDWFSELKPEMFVETEYEDD